VNNPFSGENISLDKKKKFSEDHLSRLATQNELTGSFGPMLNATTAAHEAFYGELSDKGTHEAIKKSLTQSNDIIIANFKKRNTLLNAFLIGKGLKGTVIYTKFFPQGISEFTDGVTKGNVEQKIDHIVTIVTAHTEEAGGESVLAEYKAFKNNYSTTRKAQLGKISEVSAHIDGRNTAQETLDDQLFDNLLTIAKMIKGRPELLATFFNEAIIRPTSTTTDDAHDTQTAST
jgi:hypothetical protein